MTNNASPDSVDAALDTLLKTEDEVLRLVRENTDRQGLPAIEVSAQQGKLLEILVKMSGAKNILEIGTLAAYSTICLARGGGEDSYVTSLEYESKHALVAGSHLNIAGISHRAEIIVGDALDTLQMLKLGMYEGYAGWRGAFDFVFIDADKENNRKYTQWALELGTDDVTILVDNVIRDGRIMDSERADKWKFMEFLSRQADLDVSVVQTVGSKGWDGFVLAKRKM